MKDILLFTVGRNDAGELERVDLVDLPHLLIAGSSGAGKSVMVHGILGDLTRRNSSNDLKLILIDLQGLELTRYSGIPHLLTPVVMGIEHSRSSLRWAAAETQRRLKLLAETGMRSIAERNPAHPQEAMPHIVIVIESMTELMLTFGGDIESSLNTVARMGRVTGIHLVVVANRPTVDIVPGLLKTYMPARIAFHAVSGLDSRIVLDRSGAEKLSRKGEMLFVSPDHLNPIHLQAEPVSEDDITALVDKLREPHMAYNNEVLAMKVTIGNKSGGGDGEIDDDLFEEAAKAVIRAGKASASLLQRHLGCGYARSARLMDILEERGVIGPINGARPREVLISSLEQIE